MTEQLELIEPKQSGLPADATAVCKIMRMSSGALSKREIARRLGWVEDGCDWDRRVKQAVEDSQGIILGAPGLPYVHHERISADEYTRTYYRATVAQIRSMLTKLGRMNAAVHGRGHQVDVQEIMEVQGE